jgi:hypothetical protein
VHYAVMALGALVPLVVWGLVAWVALRGPLGHQAQEKPAVAPRGGAASGEPAGRER